MPFNCEVPNIPNGHFIHQSTTLLSHGYVECDEFYTFFGSSKRATCNSNANFVGLDGACKQIEWRNAKGALLLDLPEPLSIGWQMVLQGTPTASNQRFAINLRDNQGGYYMHMDVRFNYLHDKRKVIFNANLNNKWGKRTSVNQFPFQELEEFVIGLEFTSNTVQILVDGLLFYTFNMGSPLSEVTQVSVGGDVVIKQLKFIYDQMDD
ncbi:galactose-binding lectin l-1-like [Gigantopelta aegis]|uniref:galactose-binding lectin l-1-like n=1 Tax=Gigantopelta aegis TaxID=1735272 RepID=UPI001B88AAD5|nr:galactose-binding lectin l-1-like [Gigantopelta aegis]